MFHLRISPLSVVEISSMSPENLRYKISLSLSGSSWKASPDTAFQTSSVPSLDPEAINRESGETAMELIQFAWPSKILIHSPDSTFQSRRVPSRHPDTSRFGFDKKATAQTPSLWPCSTCMHSPRLVDQIRIVSSRDAEATSLESDEKPTPETFPT